MMAARAERWAWILGALGAGGSAAGWLWRPAEFPHAWLAALACGLGWPIGSLALIFIHALTGGRWGHAIRGALAPGIATLPLMLAAALPIFFVLPRLYPWMHPDVAAHLDNRFYLNAPFFYVRCAVYVSVWLGLGYGVLRTLGRVDCESVLYRMAAPGLMLLALSVTFSAIDFTLSMNPHFKSSVYGILIGCECLLLALSVAVMTTAVARRGQGPHLDRDLGRLLLALLVLWAYLDFMQVLIVWNSDLPEEAAWYSMRLQGGWMAVAGLVAICHFLLPFFALIWPQVQRSRVVMGAAAAFLMLIEVVRVWWIVSPAADRGLGWVDVAAMAAVLGVAAAIACRVSRRSSLASGVFLRV